MKNREYRKKTFAQRTKGKLSEWLQDRRDAIDEFFADHDWRHGRSTSLYGLLIGGFALMVYGMTFAGNVRDGIYVKSVLADGRTVFIDATSGEPVSLLSVQGSGFLLARIIAVLAVLMVIAGIIEIIIFKSRERKAD